MSKPIIFDDRYKCVDILKKKEDYEYFKGIDLVTQQKIIVKIYNSSKYHEFLEKIKIEHELLKNTSNSNITSTLDYGEDDNQIYLIFPYIDHLSLAEHLKINKLSFEQVINLGLGIFSALQDIHHKGLLHLNIRPDNIFVEKSFESTEIKLLCNGTNHLIVNNLNYHNLDNIRYMAPEQAGINNVVPNNSSDLFSVGVLLFECFSGHKLFEDSEVSAILRQFQIKNIPHLQSFNPKIPTIINDFVKRLLQRKQQDRYQSAAAAMQDLYDIYEAHKKNIEDPKIFVGLHDKRKNLTVPAFINRVKSLSALEEELFKAKNGKPSLVLISAESGGGKTRLLEEFVSKCKGRKYEVIWGNGETLSVPKPQQLLGGISPQIIRKLKNDSVFKINFKKDMGNHIYALCDIIPDFKQILLTAELQHDESEYHGEVRSIPALSMFINAIVNKETPTILILDDCQWADELTLKTIQSWNQSRINNEYGNLKILVVLSFRKEEVSEEHVLNNLPNSLYLNLKAFDDKESSNLIKSMAGDIPPKAIETTLKLSKGNPFFLMEVLQGLVESGALINDNYIWHVDDSSMKDVQSSSRAGNLLIRRLRNIDDETLQILKIGALLGKKFDYNFVAAIYGKQADEIENSLTLAVNKRLIWQSIKTSKYSFIHDKVREALLEGIPSSEKKIIHGKAAQFFSERNPGLVFEIAYHLDEAGSHQEAFSFALQAAKRAKNECNLVVAEQFYRIAEKDLNNRDKTYKVAVFEGIGDVLMLRGKYQEATEYYKHCHKLVVSKYEKARIDGKIGELAFKTGNVKIASKAIINGLESLDHKVPQNNLSFFTKLLLETFKQILNSLFPNIFIGKKIINHNARIDLLAVHLFGKLAYVWWFERGNIPTLWAHLKQMNTAEKYTNTLELGQAYSNHAPVMTMVPFFSRAIEYGRKGVEIRCKLKNLWGEAQGLHFHGVALYCATQYKAALFKFKKSYQLLERTGDRWEANAAKYHIASTLYRLGQLTEAMKISESLHYEGRAIGDQFASGAILNVWSKASEGDVPAEIIKRELKHASSDKQRNIEVMQAEGIRLLKENEWLLAVERLEKAWSLVKLSGLRTEYITSVPIWLTYGLRKQLENTEVWDKSKRENILKRAKTTIKYSRQLARKFKNNLPHAQREYAFLMAIMGKTKKAKRYIDQSIILAQKQGALFELFQSLMARAQFENRFVWSESNLIDKKLREKLKIQYQNTSANYIAQSDKQLVPPSIASLDRFNSLIKHGRMISSTMSKTSIFQNLHNAVLALLRCNYCLVLVSSDEKNNFNLETVMGESPVPFDSEIGKQAITKRRNILIDKIPLEKNNVSPGESDFCSILCSPILNEIGEKVCFYSISLNCSHFGEDEQRISEFLAAQTGVALENAQRFHRIDNLSQNLEQDINHRKETEKKLHTLIQEKEVLIKEVYHRTKNNMQVISSLLDLQLPSIKDEHDLAIMKDSQTRIKSMAIVHEKLYRSTDLVNVDFKGYIGELTEMLFHSYRDKIQAKVNLLLDLDDVTLNIDLAIPCGLVINELLTNALKYAFDDGQDGTIEIKMKILSDESQEPKDILLQVRDNGKGLPPDFVFNKIKSLGLKLVKGFVTNQLQGTITLEISEGTAYIIKFKTRGQKRRL